VSACVCVLVILLILSFPCRVLYYSCMDIDQFLYNRPQRVMESYNFSRYSDFIRTFQTDDFFLEV
jgi:hypothetical protein